MTPPESSALNPLADAPIFIPTLRETSINEPAGLIPTPANASIVNWLEATGRMDVNPVQDYRSLYDEDGEAIDDFTADEGDLYEEDDLGDDEGDDY
ncbi:hypothetical protein GlitD10_0564 [Gloeomargarita lithophora Alchichica-D10]|uniref:DUF3134 domain-containing protein n=1 Tax=Gloeomargarita lithophora Alchichica-D10 TaxID=1188229 RepID=A0A1J0AAC2_9CYAN|nr:DUF3134 family protein [Gloeomargarita lithophora]APB32878.1 hypothetical protein GlitD10_0564 [Gloeomargarita lithophora Alchichica-D10]